MSTLRQILKEAKELLSKTYDTTIIYAVVCRKTDTFNDAFVFFKTLEEARECIKGINEYTMEECGWKNRLYVLPIVVGKDSYDEVTEENMQYYDKNSDWVINFLNEVYG